MAPYTEQPLVRVLSLLEIPHLAARSNVTSTGAYNQKSWPGTVNVASVDLMAMVVSDAGLASTVPEWWNASPSGCMLIAMQPRGGWQIMQRCVQWGNDIWSRSFGVTCTMAALHCYFACSIRNRLELWESTDFISPMEGIEEEFVVPNSEKRPSAKGDAPGIVEVQSISTQGRETQNVTSNVVSKVEKSEQVEVTTVKETEKPPQGGSGWKPFQLKHGRFTVRRPTKLVDGSRGGQAFMCELLCPEPGNAYSIEEQARFQFMSILLLSASLITSDNPQKIQTVLGQDFDLASKIGGIFKRLAIFLFVVNIPVLGFITSVFFALWRRNIYGTAAPYVLQICSLTAWSFGAAGLLMIGGNPRVSVVAGTAIPRHIQARLDSQPDSVTELVFGSLHGSIFTKDCGSCFIDKNALESICGWNIQLTRTLWWKASLVWFTLHILLAVVIQVAGSRVATLQSQILGIVFLVFTSIVRGRGISGPEEWMIPKWKMRQTAKYAVNLLGHYTSRAR